MAHYIRFTTADGTTILVEADADEVLAPEGVPKGFGEALQRTVGQATTSFEGALENLVRHNAEALVRSVRSLPEVPDEVEVTFGLTATGEVGSFAVAKASGQAAYTLKLAWKLQPQDAPDHS